MTYAAAAATIALSGIIRHVSAQVMTLSCENSALTCKTTANLGRSRKSQSPSLPTPHRVQPDVLSHNPRFRVVSQGCITPPRTSEYLMAKHILITRITMLVLPPRPSVFVLMRVPLKFLRVFVPPTSNPNPSTTLNPSANPQLLY